MENFNSRVNIGILGMASIAKRSIIPAIRKLPDKFALRSIGSKTYNSQDKVEEIADDGKDGPFSKIESLRSDGRNTEAFFLARRMVAEGIDGAADKVSEILQDLEG